MLLWLFDLLPLVILYTHYIHVIHLCYFVNIRHVNVHKSTYFASNQHPKSCSPPYLSINKTSKETWGCVITLQLRIVVSFVHVHNMMILWKSQVGSHRSVSGRDVLQSSDGRLLGAVTHTAGNERQVHPDGDGAPQPLDATGVGLLLQQGALPLQMLQRKQRLGWRWLSLKTVMLKKNRYIWIKVTQIKQQHVFIYLIQHDAFIVHAVWNLISLNGILRQSSWGSNKYERLVRSRFSWMIKLAAIWHLFSEYHSPKNAAFVLSAWIIVRGGLPLWSWRCDEQSSPELWAPGPSSAEVPRNLWRTT